MVGSTCLAHINVHLDKLYSLNVEKTQYLNVCRNNNWLTRVINLVEIMCYSYYFHIIKLSNFTK